MTKKAKFDKHCRKPLCIRNLEKLANGYWRFQLNWSTSTGEIKTNGWTWNPELNTIRGPMNHGFPIISLMPHSKAAVRSLFTDIMLGDNQVIVPPIKDDGLPKRKPKVGRPKGSKKREEINEEDTQGIEFRDSTTNYEGIKGSRKDSIAESHLEWGDLLI